MEFQHNKSITICDVRFDVLNYNDTLKNILKQASQKESQQICIINTHSAVLAQRDKEFKKILDNSSINTMDGMPIVWLARARGFKKAQRISGPDLFLQICKASAGFGYRHFLYGSSSETVEKLKAALIKKFPKLQIVGAYSPPFRNLHPAEEASIINNINSRKPHFLWVGLGAPRQEKFIYNHLDDIKVPVQIGVGAAFDFIAGNIRRAPAWIQQFGFEWAFRLIMEPRRLWKRYLLSDH